MMMLGKTSTMINMYSWNSLQSPWGFCIRHLNKNIILPLLPSLECTKSKIRPLYFQFVDVSVVE